MKNLKKIAILASIYKALHKIEVQNSGKIGGKFLAIDIPPAIFYVFVHKYC